MFDIPKRETRLSAGLGASLLVHAVLLVILLAAFAFAPTQMQDLTKNVVKLVYLQEPGPGGGGGGSPAPAPPKPIEIPQHKAPPPPPVVAVVPVLPPPPLPTLTAPVVTPNALTMQATGRATISTAPTGGGGRGNGQGDGQGSGLDKGTGGGTGGDVYAPGSGVIDPKVVKEVPPKYTSEAMRAKIQGVVLVQVLINEDGTVDPDVRVTKSLDSVNGLDQEAMKAARGWLFQPAMLRSTGKPVKYRASLELAFRIF